MASHELHNLVPHDDKEWITIIRSKNKIRSSVLHGGVSDDNNKKLELRLGPPGDHHHEEKRQLLDQERNSWLTFHTQKQNLKEAVLQPLTKPNSYFPNYSLNIISQQARGFPVNIENHDDDDDHLHSSDPVSSATVSKFANSSAPKCCQKRDSARRATVVGWPPVRSCRRNIGSNSFSKTPSVSNYGNELCEEELMHDQEKSEDDHMFVKINMEGVPIGRKVDLKAYDSYDKLSYAIDELFRGLLAAQRDFSLSQSDERTGNHTKTVTNIGEYTLVYEDDEGDRMLVGDVPWKMFVSTAKRLRVLRSTELSTLKLSSSHIIEKTPLGSTMEIAG